MSTASRKAPGANSIFYLAVCGFLSPIMTFAIAMTSLSAQTKISALAFIATAYAAFYFVYRQSVNRLDSIAKRAAGDVPESHHPAAQVDLTAGCEETLRKTVKRVREKLAIKNAFLFEVGSGGDLRLVAEDLSEQSDGGEKDLSIFKMAAISGEIESENDQNAVPLAHDGRIFAVLGFEFQTTVEASAASSALLGIVSEMESKFAAAFAYDLRVSTALTDPVTSLPNERAFLMVLDHQLAESLRHREERPLSVIAIDVSSFANINEKFGHAIGDRALRFAAETLRTQFRSMDFLARIRDDEFLAVVPLADEKSANEIVFRVSNAFLERKFEFDNEHSIALTVNSGIATFWQDGETTQQLIRHAQQTKQRSKAEGSVAATWLEKEYVH